ncbi:MAG: hypothetical protein ACP5D2_04365 [Candidatus Nanoarchaeia archaeon]
MHKLKIPQVINKLLIIIITASILGLVVAYPSPSLILTGIISFLIIISVNVLVKEILAYYYEANLNLKFWAWYQYWFRKDSHFKKPIPMLWLPLLLIFLTKGLLIWLSILEFDVSPKTERAAKRHGLYRFTEITDWHLTCLATAGIIANLVLAIIGYIAGFEFFARLNIYFAFWSIIPIGNLDGSKILFGSRLIWIIMLIITGLFLSWSLVII